MSAPKRRSQQPPFQPQQQHSYQQQHYHHQSLPQQYAQDANYSQFTSSPYQQQQLYYPHQQYPPADPYALANNAAQASASTSPYPQQVQYQNNLYQPHPQTYAAPTGLGYPNATTNAYPQGGYYAAADYVAAGDLSPSHLTPGSASSGHSPRPGAGRARLNNFVFPSQGTSPSLESQVAHLNLAALPSKLNPYQAGNQVSHPASGIAYPSHHAAFASHTQAANALAGQDGHRSGISLRYPPLPSVPDRCATPPPLQPRISDDAEAAQTTESEAGPVDPSVLDYVSSLRSVLTAYEKRDELLRLRTEAVGFQPRQAWSAWQSQQSLGSESSDKFSNETPNDQDPPSNPILGVRLLQRLDKLQCENDELGRLLSSGASVNTHAAGVGDRQVDELRKEVQDCHRLIEAMDQALSSAEARAAASERALQVACQTNSTAMLPAKQDGVVTAPPAASEENKKPPPKTTPAAKKGSKTAKSNSAKTGSQQQRTNNPPPRPTAAPSTRTSKPPASKPTT